MKKSDLKTGMVVECKNGEKFIVIENNLIRNNGYMTLDSYNDDLTTTDDKFGYSVIKVYEADEIYELCENSWKDMPCIWERKKEEDVF